MFSTCLLSLLLLYKPRVLMPSIIVSSSRLATQQSNNNNSTRGKKTEQSFFSLFFRFPLYIYSYLLLFIIIMIITILFIIIAILSSVFTIFLFFCILLQTSRKWQTRSHARYIILAVWLGSLAIMSPVAVLSQLKPVGNDGTPITCIYGDRMDLMRTIHSDSAQNSLSIDR